MSSLLLCILFAGTSWTVQAQSGDRAACFTANTALARQVSAYKADKPRCTAGQRGCGSNGGPGYRSYVSGECVSWTELNKACGPPPHNDCFAECFTPTGTCTLPDELTDALLSDTAPNREPDDWTIKPERPRSE